jgi:hypothetical protein
MPDLHYLVLQSSISISERLLRELCKEEYCYEFYLEFVLTKYDLEHFLVDLDPSTAKLLFSLRDNNNSLLKDRKNVCALPVTFLIVRCY